MNKTIIININSIVFHIEEDAYETLRAYMIEIKRHFGKSEDSREILEDIENRIAEMFSERIHSGRKEVINMEDVNEVIAQMGRVSDFDSELEDEIQSENRSEARTEGNTFQAEGEPGFTEEPNATQGEPVDNESSFANYTMSKRLMRDMDDKVFGGVCSGLAQYFNIESKWVRIIFILFFLFGGSGVLLYFVLWAVMPKALTRADKLAMRGEQANLHNFKKSFDEEMKNVRENFSGAGEQFNRGARSAGDVIGRSFSLIGKIFASIGLFVSGATVVGLFIFWVFNVLNIMGYDNDIYFPTLEILEPTSAFIAITAGFLAIGIPFLAFFFLMLRVLFKGSPLNNYASVSMFAAWVGSIIVILYMVIVTNQEFKEESTISVEKSMEKKAQYIISLNDVRVIKASDEDFRSNKFEVTRNGKTISGVLRDNIGIRFEAIDSLKAPYMQYNYFSRGNSYGDASARASQIKYQVQQNGENILFDSHFSILKQPIIRDQHVSIKMFLPIGTKVMINDNVENKVQDIWAYDCPNNEGEKLSEWIMTKAGLRCVKKMEEERLKALEDAKEEAEEAEKDAKEEAEDAVKEAQREAKEALKEAQKEAKEAQREALKQIKEAQDEVKKQIRDAQRNS